VLRIGRKRILGGFRSALAQQPQAKDFATEELLTEAMHPWNAPEIYRRQAEIKGRLDSPEVRQQLRIAAEAIHSITEFGKLLSPQLGLKSGDSIETIDPTPPRSSQLPASMRRHDWREAINRTRPARLPTNAPATAKRCRIRTLRAASVGWNTPCSQSAQRDAMHASTTSQAAVVRSPSPATRNQ
jgi:hypothetical protein